MAVIQFFSIFVYGNEEVTTSSKLLFDFIFYTMTQKEFEDRIGRQVLIEEYANANSIYMACSFEKDEFCEKYKRSDKDLLLNITENYYSKKNALDAFKIKLDALTKRTLAIAYDGENTTLRNEVREVLGQRAFVIFCLENGYELDQQDREYVLFNLKS